MSARECRDWWRTSEDEDRSLSLVEDGSILEYLLEGDPDLFAFAARLRTAKDTALETTGKRERDTEYIKALWDLDALMKEITAKIALRIEVSA